NKLDFNNISLPKWKEYTNTNEIFYNYGFDLDFVTPDVACQLFEFVDKWVKINDVIYNMQNFDDITSFAVRDSYLVESILKKIIKVDRLNNNKVNLLKKEYKFKWK
ncbi:18451_t:CDS:1, partial [Funneliformis geosporum]